jgi:hypothetical protein
MSNECGGRNLEDSQDARRRVGRRAVAADGGTVRREESAQSEEKSAAPAKCLEAAVNPVTGFAFCINPRGAPVDPPPVSSLHPCKPRAHDNDPMTVYERWSGCGD